MSALKFRTANFFIKPNHAVLLALVLLLFLPATKAAAAPEPSFEEAVTYSVGIEPISIFAGDFNRDGKLDLAVANSKDNNISILPANGDGTFQAAVNYRVGSFPRSVTAADFNSDGVIDLAVANFLSNNVSILLGNGDGSFQGLINYPAGMGPYSIAAADFNGDGHIDLAVANFTANKVSILLGNGNGNFQETASFPANSSPYSVTAADFNGDGHIDLAVANYTTDGTVSILLGNGDATFQTPQDYSVGSRPCSLIAGDFNGDGSIDLAVANSGANNISILAGSGDGDFQGAATYPVGDTPRGLAAGDFNGDGIIDLAVTNSASDSISILAGKGDGSFLEAVCFPAGSRPLSIAAADYNGDGKIDIATANNTFANISVLLNNTALPCWLQFSQESYQVAEDAGTAPITITRSGSSDSIVSAVYSTADGTARAELDYLPASGILRFNAGETTSSFTVVILDNEALEAEKTVVLSLTQPSGGAALGNPKTAILTIIDNETPDPVSPLIVSSDPLDGSVNITDNKVITIIFSEEVQPGDNVEAISLRKGEKPVAYAYSFSGSILAIKPLDGLEYSSSYVLTIPAGAVEDLAGNSLATDFRLNFSTQAAPADENKFTPPTEDNDSTSPAVLPAPSTQRIISAAQIQGAAADSCQVRLSRPEAARGIVIANSALRQMQILECQLRLITPEGELILPPSLAKNVLAKEPRCRVVLYIASVFDDDNQQQANGLQPAGSMIDIAAVMETGSQQESLTDEFHLVLNYYPEQVQNIERLGIYSFNDRTWQYTGSQLDAGSAALTTRTQHFSRYAVFEDRRSFPDLDSHWAKNDLEIILSRYLISGHPDGLFVPEATVTRAKFATMLANTLDFAGIKPQEVMTAVPFSDVPPQARFATVIDRLAASGLIYGYPDARFKPNDYLTRAEGAVLALRLLEYLGIDPPQTSPNTITLAAYKDAPEATDWSRQALEQAVLMGLLHGTGADELQPKAKLTRAQAAVIIKRVLEKAELI